MPENLATKPKPDAADDPIEAVDAVRHRPFRSWALQQDLVSLIGADAVKKRSPELGLEPLNESRSKDLPGQAYLRGALEPDPRRDLRTKTSIALWASALFTDSLNQWGPSGVQMSPGAFTFTFACVILALAFTTIVYPRLSDRPYSIVEQIVLVLAYALIGYQCYETGGVFSPYSVWLIFPVFYVGYLRPAKQAAFNVALAIIVALAPIVYASETIENDGMIVLLTLIIAICVIAATLLYQRTIERNVERAVNFLALADPLTGVANLRSFEQLLDDASDDKFALVMADMNGLKGANKVFGHEVGDGMIIRMSQLMLDCSDPDSQVVRLGGDEFAVVIPGGSEAAAAAWQKRFETAMQDHNDRVRGKLPQISAAVGLAIRPRDGISTSDLLDAADRRMYEQKSPAVQPPYEVDGPASVQPGRILTSRFSDAPRRSFEYRDQRIHATMVSLIIGVLTISTATYGPGPESRAWCVALGVTFIALGLIGQFGTAGRLVSVGRICETAALVLLLPMLLATGGWQSPIQLVMIFPVAFYAQYLRGRHAVSRIGALIAIYAVGVFAGGGVSDVGQAQFLTIVTAMIIISVILQTNGKTLDKSLEIVRESATHDPLTGIKNVHAFRAEIDRAIAAITDHAVPVLLIADLDDFRRVNTMAGHRGGDAILRQAVDHLCVEAGNDSTVYRVGGDEFAVLCSAESKASAAELAERCRNTLAFRGSSIDSAGMRVTASVGWVMWRPGQDGEGFVESAEAELEAVKNKAPRGDSSGASVLL
jgi:diguanylate cyclase (GGDEF)-like protein